MERKYNKKKSTSLRALISFSVVITVNQFLDSSKDSVCIYKHMYVGMCIFFKPDWQHVIYLLCTLLFTKKEILSSCTVGIP